MGTALDRISIQGFRSIRRLDNLTLDPRLNVLIGANGAGKSNFVDFFRLLRAMYDRSLAAFIKDGGGADGYAFDGPKPTPVISAHLAFGSNEYRFSLKPEVNGTMTVLSEGALFTGAGDWTNYTAATENSRLKGWLNTSGLVGRYGKQHYIADAVSSWMVYHFHDTSRLAGMRRKHAISNHRELSQDAANIAPFLRKMKESHPLTYAAIVQTVQLVAPFFEDFLLEEEADGENLTTRLEWKQKASTYPFQPWQLSDGTIRFIALATALLQPRPPSTIVIDEPELGLHPFALETLASVIHDAAQRTQVILATQSPILLSRFEPEQIIVVDRQEGASNFRRLERTQLEAWLGEYSLGELLQKNIIQASPRYET